MGGIVGAQGQAHGAVPFLDILGLDRLARSLHGLVGDRGDEARPTLRATAQLHVALPIQVGGAGAAQVQADRPHRRVGRQIEVEYQLALPAVVTEVHAGIDAGVAEGAVAGHPEMPLRRVVPFDVVAHSRQPVGGVYRGGGTGGRPRQAQGQHDSSGVR